MQSYTVLSNWSYVFKEMGLNPEQVIVDATGRFGLNHPEDLTPNMLIAEALIQTTKKIKELEDEIHSMPDKTDTEQLQYLGPHKVISNEDFDRLVEDLNDETNTQQTKE